MARIMRHANLLSAILLLHATTAAADQLETLVVTATRAPVPLAEAGLALAHIDANTIAAGMHQHLGELAFHAPGTWISRGSGQEQLTAIRSPVLTGAGSCGAFLFMEDGIPIRPAGFCNVNQAFELNTGQAQAIEVARGPASAVWGANALHGAINVRMDTARPDSLTLGAGPDDYFRTRLEHALHGNAMLLLNAEHDGGFRDDSGYDQAKLNFFAGGGELPRLRLAATRLQQETAGFITGAEAWRNETLRTTNPNPEAFRDADAQRLSMSWDGSWPVSIYARNSRMQFLQHFLPGQPLEQNGQRSAGVTVQRVYSAGQWQVRAGGDAEYARGWLRQSQGAATDGSDFLRETRPSGTHYDYDADSLLAALWLDATRALTASMNLRLALRAETLGYRYDNHAADGNLRDDGSACGFGGCLYNRPADRNDRFFNAAPRLALSVRPADHLVWWLQAGRGFRPPQATELYRLQRGQDTAEIDSEVIDNFEAGLRVSGRRTSLELTGYASRKKNYILRDADGFNISDGRSRHHGIEAAFGAVLHPRLRLDADLSNNLHRYDFDSAAARGEVIRSGAQIDTAPQHIATTRLRWQYQPGGALTLEWLHLGSYSMDAAGSRRYPGHDLLNVYAQQELGNNWMLRARLVNAGDTLYAERADFAFGTERYFPGRRRSLYLDLHWRSE